MWEFIGDIFHGYIFWYPFVMTLVWIVGALLFCSGNEKDETLDIEEIEWPSISILIPCYNESETIGENIEYLSQLSYPDFEIIAVNDGSSDDTGKILAELAEQYSCLRVIDCKENRGKANALHIAAHAAKSEYLVCIDSDAILDDKAPYYLVQQFMKKGERVGAVTGNPRIRNRDTLIAKIQLVEYASIIGSIKRTQRIMGKLMTVSGVVVAFRKKALVSVGLWDRDMITEDVAISWKLQKKFWDIRYEPRALCWMLVPENLSGLWRQRVRWAQGGQEVLCRHIDIFKDWRQRRLWPTYIEQVLSIVWGISWVVDMVIILLTAKNFADYALFFSFSAFALTMICLIQFFVAIRIDSTYDNISKYYLWAAWYPAVYWIVNVFIMIAAIPKTMKSRLNKGEYATWISPDRGQRIVEQKIVE